MKILMTGATGFVGSHLQSALSKQGHEVNTLSRHDISLGVDHIASRMTGSGAIINLAGEPINRRWTSSYKNAIVSSRVDTTLLLVEAMKKMDQKPATFISTSAIGAYDDKHRYNEYDEPTAKDFLGKLSGDWEAAAQEADRLGVRTIILRFGLVLGYNGGLMKQLLLPFRLGLGGPIGDGKQHFSWIHIFDLMKIYDHILYDKELSGVFHACAPHPVTNEVFTQTLAHALHRPALLRVPGLFLKMAFGEGAQVMTSGQCVVSERFNKTGFSFRYPGLDSAIQAIVKQAKGNSQLDQLFGSFNRSSG